MSRSYTIKVSCLGTTLEWDCGESIANSVYNGVTAELNEVCKDNERSGEGFCGTVNHKMEGLMAFHHVGKLASKMFTAYSTGKAVLLREFVEDYIEVMSGSQHICELMDYDLRSTAPHLVRMVLDKVAELGFEQAMMSVMDDAWHYELLLPSVRQPQLDAAFAKENWALSLEISASR